MLNGDRPNEKKATPVRLIPNYHSMPFNRDAAFRALDMMGTDYPGLRSRCSLQPGLSQDGPSARKLGGLKVRNVIAWGEANSAQPQADDGLWNSSPACRAGTDVSLNYQFDSPQRSMHIVTSADSDSGLKTSF